MAVPLNKRTTLCNVFLSLCGSFLLCISLSSCPYSAAYRLDEEPKYQVNEAHLGKWAAIATDENGTQRPVKMILTKQTDFEYGLTFTGYFDELNECRIAKNDTIRATGFLSMVGNKQFMNVQLHGVNYLAEFLFDNDKITILPLCEHFTNRIVKSSLDLRKAVTLHFRTRLYPLYDEPFCLREMVRVN